MTLEFYACIEDMGDGSSTLKVSKTRDEAIAALADYLEFGDYTEGSFRKITVNVNAKGKITSVSCREEEHNLEW